MKGEPAESAARPRRTGAGQDRAGLYLALATILFGLVVRSGAINAVAALAATVLLLASVATARRSTRGGADMADRLLVGALVFGLLGLIGWAPPSTGPQSFWLTQLPGAIWVVLSALALVLRARWSRRSSAVLVGATLTAVAVFGVANIAAMEGSGFDVFFLHVAAADAMADGENPYTDAVEVPDGSPEAAPGDTITGYVYPPTTAVGYALGHWLSPDARYASLVAWLIVLGAVGLSSLRTGSRQTLSSMLLLASVPGLWFVFRAAWTEPLSLALMTLGAVWWSRPVASGLGLGGMLSSKQYFVVTAPLLVLHRDRHWGRRLAVALGVIAVTVGAALLWDFTAFWESAVAFHTSTPPRPDSSNLVGLLSLAGVEWAPPAVLPIAAGLAAATWAGVGSTTRRAFLVASASALSASFLFASQTFANYWFMVFGLCALALLADPDIDAEPA